MLLLIGISMAHRRYPISPGDLQEREVRSSALSLAAVARDLRSRALFDGIAQQLVVNLPQNSYRVAAATREFTCRGCEIHFRRRRRGGRSRYQEILFFPNGSGLGGEIVLADGEQCYFLSYSLGSLSPARSKSRAATDS